jgi:hypothetical protein
MKIPILEEIVPKNFDINYFQRIFKSDLIKYIPIYINFKEIPSEDHIEAYSNIQQALRSVGRHPYFPYPIYVISTELNEKSLKNVVSDENNLPLHFTKRTGKPKSKELPLFNKVKILSEKVSNLQIREKFGVIKHFLDTQNNFNALSREHEFYKKIMNKIVQVESLEEYHLGFHSKTKNGYLDDEDEADDYYENDIHKDNDDDSI